MEVVNVFTRKSIDRKGLPRFRGVDVCQRPGSFGLTATMWTKFASVITNFDSISDDRIKAYGWIDPLFTAKHPLFCPEAPPGSPAWPRHDDRG
jgi:hypothetical protein